MNKMTDRDLAYWLADKIPAYGDYAKQSADVLKRQADKIERNWEAIAELVAALEHAEKWMHGWASAEPYIDYIRAAITKHDTQPTKKGSN